MVKKYELVDVIKSIRDKLDSPEGRTLRAGIVGTLEIVNPIAGVAGDVVNSFLGEYNLYKLNRLLDSLSKKLNVEQGINLLYTYVNSSQEKAINVANLFKQTCNAECPKVCVIYGWILAEHIDNNTNFTHNELIVCKALENATDYDLKNFKEIMDGYIQSTSDGDRIVFAQDFEKADTYTTTCDWGVYNRLFCTRMGIVKDETIELGTCYYTTKSAELLLKNIKEIQQIWGYNEENN